MASTITHFSIGVLYYYFSNLNLVALLIGSQVPDFESIYFIKNITKKKEEMIKSYLNFEQGFFHTLLGLIITLPLCFIISYFLCVKFNFPTTNILFSSLIGILSHLLLDIPGHRYFLLFYPYKIKNPFLFKIRLGILEKFYPWSKYESKKKEVICEYNWFVFSHIFLILAVLLYLLK